MPTPESGQDTTLFGIPLSLCTLEDGIRRIEEVIEKRAPGLIVLANAHTFNIVYEDSRYKEALAKASCVLRDGVGVEWAVKKKGMPAFHNFVGTDFIPDFCRLTAHKGYRYYLLGAREENCRLAARKLESLAPGIIISGYHHGYFQEDETKDIIENINGSKADILLVALGNPGQELWISENLHRLAVPACIGVGALFDYLAGSVPRAPRWMLRSKMEWIYRLMVEPKRLWKRYLVGNPKFIIRFYMHYKVFRKASRCGLNPQREK